MKNKNTFTKILGWVEFFLELIILIIGKAIKILVAVPAVFIISSILVALEE